MKRVFAVFGAGFFCAGLFATVMAGSAYADRPGADWISAATVIEKVTAKGYSNIGKVEADDGHWEVKATLNGVRYELDVDPRTGEIIKSERDN